MHKQNQQQRGFFTVIFQRIFLLLLLSYPVAYVADHYLIEKMPASIINAAYDNAEFAKQVLRTVADDAQVKLWTLSK